MVRHPSSAEHEHRGRPAARSRTWIRLRGALLIIGVAIPVALAVRVAIGAVGGADPSGRIVPLVVAALITTLLILVKPDAGVVGAIIAIVWIGLVRRLVGGQSAYVENDPLISVPAALVIPAVVVRLRAQPRATAVTWLCLVLLGIMAVATGYGFTRAPFLAVARSAAFEVLPIALALGLIWTYDVAITRMILTTLRVMVPLAAVYGLVQYFAPPAWDLAFLVSRAEVATTYGYAVAGEFRLFGPTSSPLAFATLLGIGILLWTFTGAPLAARIPLIALMIVPLLLTLVRTSVFALVVALAIALLRARGTRVVLPLLVGAAAAYASITLVAALNPDIASRFLVSNLGGDESYLARSALLAQYFTSSVLSLGIGFGTVLNGSASVDNGFLAAFIELGFLGGLLFVAIPIGVLLQSRRRSAPGHVLTPAQDAAIWAVVVFFVLSEISAPIVQGEFGFIFWPCIGALVLRSLRPPQFTKVPAIDTSRLLPARAASGRP